MYVMYLAGTEDSVIDTNYKTRKITHNFGKDLTSRRVYRNSRKFDI